MNALVVLKNFVIFFCSQLKGIPFYKLFPQDRLKKLFRELKRAELNCNPLDYASFCLFSTLACLALVFPFLSLYFGLLESIVFSLVFSALLLHSTLSYPSSLAAERTQEFERDLPTGLKTIHLGLYSGNSFELCLQNAASGHGVFSHELSKALNEIKAGLPVSQALGRLSQFDSLLAKRAAAQLVFEYEHGGKGEGLSLLADEALSRQQAAAKEFGSRLSFYTVLFVGASAVLPALFSAYAIIAGSFLEIPFSRYEILLGFVVLFPLVDFALIWRINSMAPKLLSAK